ncbi:MAG: DUF262 domain-containing protein, partial [Epsilonproteobacteria bacterium]|nr:DUF262 domain-containing protein [Campylobacterota bacterium]
MSKIPQLVSLQEMIEARYHFFIPRYQRGYRWGRQEVEELLEDILEFMEKKKEEKDFYCLQPLTLRQRA